MCRASGNNEVCFENLEEALAKSPETYKHLDLIVFGFPCQDISHANPKGAGIKGKKSSIFFECIRIVQLLIPKWLLIENVPRLLSINKGKDFGIVLQKLAESGYGYCWNVLDSQYFGVPQRRKRLFIAGCFGRLCPPEILAEPKSNRRDNKTNGKIRPCGLCLTTRTRDRQNPTAETYIASTIQASDYKKVQHGQFGNEGNLIASTIKGEAHNSPSILFGDTFVANTINAAKRGSAYRIWQDNYIAETNPNRKGEVARIPRGLDSARGVVIGNAVSVPVAKWIGKRIIEYEQKKHLGN